MAVNKLGQSMIGSKAPRSVKQPMPAVPALVGSKAGKAKHGKGSRGKNLKMANGINSGVMRNPS